MRPEPGKRDGVGADVALQVDALEPRHLPEAREVESDDAAQNPGSSVKRATEYPGEATCRDTLVPARPVNIDGTCSLGEASDRA